MVGRLRALKESVVGLRTALIIAIPLAIIVIAAFWAAFQFVEPAPPDRVVLAAGGKEGAYYAFALQYRVRLAQNGITVEVLETEGSVDNLAQLEAAVMPPSPEETAAGGETEGPLSTNADASLSEDGDSPLPVEDDAVDGADLLPAGDGLSDIALDGAAVPVQEEAGPPPQPDLIFLQGGVAPPLEIDPLGEAPDVRIVSLGEVFVEPLWLFYRRASFPEGPPGDLRDLAGKRTGIGGEGSGTRALVTRLLDAVGLPVEVPTFQSIPGADAAEALQDGRLDAIFVVAAPRAGLVRRLLRVEGIAPASFTRAAGFAQRYPDLQTVTLFAGAIDPALDIPDSNIAMVAPVASLVARADLHPAIVALLLDAAELTHGPSTLFAEADSFPRARGTSFPLHAAAERFLNDGPPFLQRYLPFWLAILIDRMMVLLIPVVAVLLPLIRFFPPLYEWRMRMRVNRWYRRVSALEDEVMAAHNPDERASGLLRLDRLDDEVSRIVVPLGYAHTVYQLRQHIRLVRVRHAPTETQEAEFAP